MTWVGSNLEAEGDINSDSDPEGDVLIDPKSESRSDEDGGGGEKQGSGGGSEA